ncbi:MAG TPA: hypothetical protein VMS93_11925 [Candidatus Saccharimonadales bacterium]|nr:hypothetical protein [Candidatus Saccharimonadales bacterium]
MIHLEMTPGEAAMLADVLSIYLAELRAEIAHTDAREFRHSLKEREVLVRSMIERLHASPALAAGQPGDGLKLPVG